jgi:hypothetical protein
MTDDIDSAAVVNPMFGKIVILATAVQIKRRAFIFYFQ